MADEAEIVEGVAEVAEVEEAKPPRTVEDLATELGWKPEAEWKGEGWQPAEDYLRAPRERRDDSKREIRGLRDQIDRLASTSSQILADRLAERDAHWAKVQAKAVEDGDHAAVNKAVEERLKLKDNAPPDRGLPPETIAFMEDNKDWFGKDRLATAHAKRVAAELAQDGEPTDVQLKEALRSVKRTFPELFPAAKPPPGTQTGASRAANTGSKAKGFADMPPESQAMAKDYLKRHGMALEDFAKSYWHNEAKRRA